MSVIKPHLWTETNIGDIANVIMGQSPPGDTYNTVTQGLPFYQGKADFGEDFPTPRKWCPTPSRIAEMGDILLSVRAPVGPTNMASERCGIGRGLSAIRAFPEMVDPYFLLYFLRRYEPQLVSRGTGSTFSSVNREDIEGIRIFIPPLPEQQRIVAILRQAADLRRQRREADQLAQKLLPTLFNEMFGDPMTNPKGWPVVKAGSLMTSCEYGSSDKANETGQGIPMIRMNNVTYGGNLHLDDLKHVPLSNEEYQKYALKPGDILFNRTNSKELVGKTAMWDGQFDAIPASYFIRVRFDPLEEHPKHFAVFMNLPYMKKRLLDMARGAIGQSNINAKELQSILLPKPPIKLQEEFAIRAQKLSVVVYEQVGSHQQFDVLFQSTLARAFTGELTAAWRETHQPELHSAAARRDDWLKERGVRRTQAVVESPVAAPVVVAEHSPLAQLSTRQQQLYALVQRQPAPHFTAQSLIDSQSDEKNPLELDVISRGLTLLESLGLVQSVSVPVSPGGATSYQRVYRIPAAYDGASDLEALRKQYPNIVNTYEA